MKHIGYTKEIDENEAARRFAAKQGYQPVEVVDGGAIWLAGPIGVRSRDDLRVNRVQSARPMTEAEALQLAMKFEGK